LRRESPAIRLESIFPIDSIPAWATIFRGVNPAKHGLVYSFDVFEESWNSILKIDRTSFEGRTFWDYASDAGKEVCILFPLVAYPAWPVRGTMVSRSLTGGIDTWPKSVLEDYDLSDFAMLSGTHPGEKGLAGFAEKAKKIVRQEAKIASRILSTRDWDLAFVFFGSLDSIQHIFWRYCDPDDPTYPGPTPIESVIRDFYVLLDQIVGELMQAHPEAVVMVFSDHGHGMRPPKTVNINELLREKGLLFSKAHSLNPGPRLLEASKRLVLDLVHRFELDHLMLRISKLGILSSVTKDVYMSKASIDMDRTVAYLSSFAGPKSYPYGGIEIEKHNLGNVKMEYEEVRSQVLDLLAQVKEPETGESLVEWACRREDYYSGSHLDQYPDVLFELREGYGIYWGIHTPLIGTAYEHNLASGGHKKEAVFLIHDTLGREAVVDDMVLMDVAPTVLSLLGIDGSFGFDGESIFRTHRSTEEV
jgi:predicted AlkP superfamily phosphohydrolase/phosphomutase